MKVPESLYQKALAARQNAYAPYSNFKVGAALLSDKGNIFVGANAENVSYPCGTCAEAGAIAAMVAAGDKKIEDIVIVADSKNLITPCGACLQRIFEFSGEKTRVHLGNLEGIQKTYRLRELLPMAFFEELCQK